MKQKHRIVKNVITGENQIIIAPHLKLLNSISLFFSLQKLKLICNSINYLHLIFRTFLLAYFTVKSFLAVASVSLERLTNFVPLTDLQKFQKKISEIEKFKQKKKFLLIILSKNIFPEHSHQM